MIAELKADLTRARTREGMAVANAKGKFRGRQPKLNSAQEQRLVKLWNDDTHTTAELADLFGVGRFPADRAIQRSKPAEYV